MVKTLYTLLIVVLMFSVGQIVRLKFLEDHEMSRSAEEEVVRIEMGAKIKDAPAGSILVLNNGQRLIILNVEKPPLGDTEEVRVLSMTQRDTLENLSAKVTEIVPLPTDSRYKEELDAMLANQYGIRKQP